MRLPASRQGHAGRTHGVTDTERVSDELNRIPPSRRRQMALVLVPIGLVLLIVGIMAASLAGLGWKLVGCCVAVLAVALLGMAWGLLRSAALSESALAEQRLDAAIMAASGSTGSSCGPAGGCGDAGGSSPSSACGVAGACGLAGSAEACGSCLSREALSPRTG